MTLWYGNQPHVFELLKVDDLPFPVLLGRDAPGFLALVQTAVQKVAVAEEDLDVAVGTLSQAEGYDPGQSVWVLDSLLLQEQQTDDTLNQLREDLAAKGLPPNNLTSIRVKACGESINPPTLGGGQRGPSWWTCKVAETRCFTKPTVIRGVCTRGGPRPEKHF